MDVKALMTKELGDHEKVSGLKEYLDLVCKVTSPPERYQREC